MQGEHPASGAVFAGFRVTVPFGVGCEEPLKADFFSKNKQGLKQCLIPLCLQK